MSNITPFNFESHNVRVITDEEGEPWFIAADVCAALGIGNTTDALRRLDDDEQALVSIEGISRGNDQINIINESGLYSLILGSRKPEAKRFKRWVTHDVLPTIRKTGGYQMPKRPAPKKPTVTQVARDFDALLKLGKKLGLDDNAAAISANQAISKLCDTNLLEAMGQLHLVNKEQELYFTPTELGQSFGLSGFRVNQILERAGLQHKVGGKWVPAAHRMNLCRILDTGKSHGSGVPVQQVKWLREALEMALEDVAATPFC